MKRQSRHNSVTSLTAAAVAWSAFSLPLTARTQRKSYFYSLRALVRADIAIARPGVIILFTGT